MISKNWNRRVLAGFLGAMLVLSTVPAFASFSSDYTFLLDYKNFSLTGSTGPYIKVEIDYISATSAQIQVTSLSDANYKYWMGTNNAFFANVNATNFSVVIDSNPELFDVAKGGQYQADGYGKFNLNIGTHDASNGRVDSILFTLTNASGVWSSAMDVLSPNSKGALAAAHIIPYEGNMPVGTTGYASNVPIPGAAYLMGSGLMALLGLGFRRKRSS